MSDKKTAGKDKQAPTRHQVMPEQDKADSSPAAMLAQQASIPLTLPDHSTSQSLRQAQALQLQRMLGNAFLQRHLAQRGTIQLQHNTERQWYNEHPEPRVTESGNRLILWNFPIDDAEVHAAHRQAIRRFLAGHSIAWLSTGSRLDITGRASESGTEGHNLSLSDRRAHAVQDIVSAMPRNRRPHSSRAWGVGIAQAVASNESPEGMARNRSVELIVMTSRPPAVPDREEKWRYAQQFLESRVDARVGGDPDLMWTPTASGVLRMIPRLPLFDHSPPNYGANVPSEPFCSTRPASNCMPQPHFETRMILGEQLERAFRLNNNLSNRQIQGVVNRFINVAEFAHERRTSRLLRLQTASSQGGGSMIQRDLQMYHEAERRYFLADPTCMWRYVNP